MPSASITSRSSPRVPLMTTALVVGAVRELVLPKGSPGPSGILKSRSSAFRSASHRSWSSPQAAVRSTNDETAKYSPGALCCFTLAIAILHLLGKPILGPRVPRRRRVGLAYQCSVSAGGGGPPPRGPPHPKQRGARQT